jgi:putative two-component system response regulator
MSKPPVTALVVEDSPVQALSLINLLQINGLNTICATDGASGLAMAQSTQPAVILLDLELPEKSGLEVCRTLKENPATADIPIIVLTARQDTVALETTFLLGAVDFIPKDAFSEAVLVETLRQLHILETDDPTLLNSPFGGSGG